METVATSKIKQQFLNIWSVEERRHQFAALKSLVAHLYKPCYFVLRKQLSLLVPVFST